MYPLLTYWYHNSCAANQICLEGLGNENETTATNELITLVGMFNSIDYISKRLSNVKEIGRYDVEWILLAQVRVPWQAVVNMVMNLRSHKRQRISGLAERLLASQEQLLVELLRSLESSLSVIYC
jgi:hypothetical protein